MLKLTAKTFLEVLKKEPCADKTHKYTLKSYEKHPETVIKGVQGLIDTSATDIDFSLKLCLFEETMEKYYNK